MHFYLSSYLESPFGAQIKDQTLKGEQRMMEQPMLKKIPWHFVCGLWLYQLAVCRAGQTVSTNLGVFPTGLYPEPYPQLFFLHEGLGHGRLTSEH